MNAHDYIDYKQPITGKNDYRTSYYRGLLKLSEQIPKRTTIELKNVCDKSHNTTSAIEPIKSEQQEAYTLKEPDPYLVQNPTARDLLFMRSYDESKLRNVPKPLLPISSAYKEDYKCRTEDYAEKPFPMYMQTAVYNHDKTLIHRGEPGYARLLDPSATTSNLAHTDYTTQQLTISAKDNITFWNWKKGRKNVFKLKEDICDFSKSSECGKRRAEFRCSVKFVPNNGLTTESRSEYVPNLRSLNIDTSHIYNKLMSCHEARIIMGSENQIYGSGERIQKYIN